MVEREGEPAQGARILFVCTGNVCRSPYLELTMRAALLESGISTVTVDSAGTDALVDHRIPRPMMQVLDDHGVDGRSFRAKQLTPALIEAADLVLTAEHAHTTAVVRLRPAAARRTFTVRQLARILSFGIPATLPSAGDAVRNLVTRATAERAAAGPSSADDDIEDPWQQPLPVYERSAARMDAGLEGVLRQIVIAPRP